MSFQKDILSIFIVVGFSIPSNAVEDVPFKVNENAVTKGSQIIVRDVPSLKKWKTLGYLDKSELVKIEEIGSDVTMDGGNYHWVKVKGVKHSGWVTDRLLRRYDMSMFNTDCIELWEFLNNIVGINEKCSATEEGTPQKEIDEYQKNRNDELDKLENGYSKFKNNFFTVLDAHPNIQASLYKILLESSEEVSFDDKPKVCSALYLAKHPQVLNKLIKDTNYKNLDSSERLSFVRLIIGPVWSEMGMIGPDSGKIFLEKDVAQDAFHKWYKDDSNMEEDMEVKMKIF